MWDTHLVHRISFPAVHTRCFPCISVFCNVFAATKDPLASYEIIIIALNFVQVKIKFPVLSLDFLCALKLAEFRNNKW